MNLRRLARHWNAFAASDPMWAILTWDDKRHRGWQPEEFFATGREEVTGVLQRALELRPGLLRSRALDFGCGVGRLSLALAEHFDEVHGVDISLRMIEQARRFDATGRVAYHVNTEPHLAGFEDRQFDFIYSSITLQHMPPRWMAGYVGEFCRLLAPGGVAAFQLPSKLIAAPHPAAWRHRAGVLLGNAWRGLRLLCKREPVMNMYGVAPAVVHGWLARADGEVLAADASTMAGADWDSWLYFVTVGEDR